MKQFNKMFCFKQVLNQTDKMADVITRNLYI